MTHDTIHQISPLFPSQAHGYATNEFEVTVERLGVYLPVWVHLKLDFPLGDHLLIFIIQAEHIDNPKGYGNGEDARNYDRRLRGPVDVGTKEFLIRANPIHLNYLTQPRELDVDHRTGMKNYIANGSCRNSHQCSILTCRYSENGPWDTSKALIRRTLERCIHIGRQHRNQGSKQDEYEAYRLLGQAVCRVTSAF